MMRQINLGLYLNCGCSSCGQRAEVAIVLCEDDGTTLEIIETQCREHRIVETVNEGECIK